MKKQICIMTAIAVISAVSANAFAAVTSVPSTRTNVDTLTNGTTLVDKENGVIDAENGTTLQISAENPSKYTFTSGDYTYSLLDKDADGNYFILCADRYGQLTMNSNPVNNIFDPEPSTTDAAYAADTNIATWLNTDFINGTTLTGSLTAKKTYTAIDSLIKNHIVTHDWVIEGNTMSENTDTHLTSITKTDFKVNCKIALPSWSEYIKYSDKIGYSSTQYITNNMADSSVKSRILLRTPNKSSTSMYCFYELNGNMTSSWNVVTSNYTSIFFRPCFYVSRDYFKSVHLSSIGDNVKEILKNDFTAEELAQAGYSQDEIDEIKGTQTVIESFVLTDDMESGIDAWTQMSLTTTEPSATTVTDESENTMMSIGCPTYVYRNLPVAADTGVLTVEADIQTSHGNFGIGIIYDGESAIDGKRYPLFIGNGQSKISSITDPASSSWAVSDNASHYMIDSENILTYKRGELRTVKLIIDAKTGLCIAETQGKTSKAIDVSYIGKTNKAIGAIAFMNRSSTDGSYAYIDNVKISYDKNGSIISSMYSGNNKIKAVLRSDIDASTITKDDITVTFCDGTVKNISKVQNLSDNSILITVGNPMQDGQLYNVSINSLSATYPIVSKQLTYTAGDFSATAEITSEKYTAGETVSAKCSVNAYDFETRKIMFIVAAYNGGKLVGVNEKNINIPVSAYGEITDSIDLELESDADEIKAFVWDENQIPYSECDYAANESE